MNSKQAIEVIKSTPFFKFEFGKADGKPSKLTESLKIMINATEKTIEKSPIQCNGSDVKNEVWRCPNCKTIVICSKYADRFCQECGQKVNLHETSFRRDTKTVEKR